MNRAHLVVALAAGLAAPTGYAQDRPATCGVLNPLQGLRDQATAEPPPAGDDLRVEADRADMQPEGLTRMTGDVHLRSGERHLFGDVVDYHAATRELTAAENVIFLSESFDVRSHSGWMDLDTGDAEFNDADFFLRRQRGLGSADRLRWDDGERMTFDSPLYTTCGVGNEDWFIKASTVEIEEDAVFGEAWNARLWFLGIPVFYTPYLNFPVTDERKSGLLIPKFGNTSDTGFEVAAPIYLNIAPNHDMTLTPRFMTKRGRQLRTEYRYLTGSSQGTFTGEVLPDDDQTGETRYLIDFEHRTRLSQNWTAEADVAEASDRAYFEDLSASFTDVSQQFLESTADITYQSAWGSFRLGGQSFDVVDPDRNRQKPLERLPEAVFETRFPPKLGPFEWDTRAAAVRFSRDASKEANRFDIETGFTLPFEHPGYFVRPRVAGRFTQYELSAARRGEDQFGRDRPGDDLPETPNRVAPLASLDTGLIFERRFGQADRWTQTLEPRVFGLYVPDIEQDDLPLLDTRESSFTFTELFDTNRFNGPDRLGDAQEVSTAIGTRVFETVTGDELVNARIGQIFLLDERDVQGGLFQSSETEPFSDVLGELDISWTDDLSTDLELQFDPDAGTLIRSNATLEYNPGPDTVLNLSFRERKDLFGDRLKQTDIAAAVPVADRWRFIGRWNYSLADNRTLDRVAGFEYESCCWAVRVVHRKFVANTFRNDSDANSSIFLQLELTGLTQFGDDVEQEIQNAIVGGRRFR